MTNAEIETLDSATSIGHADLERITTKAVVGAQAMLPENPTPSNPIAEIDFTAARGPGHAPKNVGFANLIGDGPRAIEGEIVINRATNTR